jgi:hypothetical protein
MLPFALVVTAPKLFALLLYIHKRCPVDAFKAYNNPSGDDENTSAPPTHVAEGTIEFVAAVFQTRTPDVALNAYMNESVLPTYTIPFEHTIGDA